EEPSRPAHVQEAARVRRQRASPPGTAAEAPQDSIGPYAMAATQQNHYATGRRKTATARVYLKPGTGRITVNDRTLDEFFGRETGRMIVRQPLEAVKLVSRRDSARHHPRPHRVRREPAQAAAGCGLRDARRPRSRAQEGRSAQGPPRD